MRTRRFRRGEVIFHLGDPGDALFIVMSGAIKIMLPSDAGDEAILATLRPGDVFGELALLDGAPRSATATALEATETLILPRGQFRELLDTEPAIVDALLASLASELRRLTNHVEELHFLDITGRLASRLARLAAEFGQEARRWDDPAPGAPDAGRPRGDDRLHPAEREQASRHVHRRRPDPPRAGQHRRRGPRADCSGRRAASGAGARSRYAGARRGRRRRGVTGAASRARSSTSRTCAATSAARSRPWAPPRNARRRSRWARPGSTTTTVTADVVAPRPDPDPDRRRRCRRPRRPLRASASSPSVGPWFGCGSRRSSGSAWWAAAGASAASVSANLSHAAIADEGGKRAAGPDLDARPASSRAARNSAPMASAHEVSPSAQMWSPSRSWTRAAVASTIACAERPGRVAPAGPRSGRRPHRRGHTWQRPDCPPGGAPRRAAPRRPIRRSPPAGTSGSPPRRRRRARAAAEGPRSDQIGRISRGGPGRATISRPSGRETHQAGAVPLAFGRASADGMSQACFRFMSGIVMPAPRPQAAQPRAPGRDRRPASRRRRRRSPRG